MVLVVPVSMVLPTMNPLVVEVVEKREGVKERPQDVQLNDNGTVSLT